MLGKHHLILSLFTAAILVVPYFLQYPELTLLVVIGIAIGSLVPDADSPDAAIFHEKVKGVKGELGQLINGLIAPLFPIFGYTTKYLVYKPAVYVFGRTLLKNYNIEERHRGFLHSFLGVGTATVLTGIYAFVVLYLLDLFSFVYFMAFVLSYTSGALLHLVEDSATVTGTQFNYPFSEFRVSGDLITKPDFARSSDIFASILVIIAGILFFLTILEYIPYSNWVITLFFVIFLILCWTIFLVFVAKVRIERGGIKT
ncbi:MAG: metal-dependent hydrolase [Methanophagales archaeon]|nr:metal-dependent hydrolase [Methanophagales archaeon]